MWKRADGVAFRGAFIIDREGNVRSQLVNDLPLGRNIDELIRSGGGTTVHRRAW